MLKDGGTKRRQAAEAALKSVGGRVEAFYFALGEHDAVVIIDAPDNMTVAAASMAINASGAVQTKTIALLTPEEHRSGDEEAGHVSGAWTIASHKAQVTS